MESVGGRRLPVPSRVRQRRPERQQGSGLYLVLTALASLRDRLLQTLETVLANPHHQGSLARLQLGAGDGRAGRLGYLPRRWAGVDGRVDERPGSTPSSWRNSSSHAASKYLGGHSDIIGGVVIGSRALVEPIWTWRKNFGQTMAPEIAYLLGRSLRTLVVRVRRQNATAQAVAEFLRSHPRIVKVNYPGLPDFPTHAVAKDQMEGFGGTLSFVYDGDGADASAVVDRLQLFTIAPSLGGVESLVCQPATLMHRNLAPAERARRGIADGLVRISCGLEDADDLIADLKQALSH